MRVWNHYDSLRGGLHDTRNFDVLRYDIFIKDIEFEKHTINGQVKVTFVPLADLDSIQFDLQQPLEVRGMEQSSENPWFRRDSNLIFVYPLKDKFLKGDTQILTISYRGKPREAVNPPWNGGFVWRNSTNDRPWLTVACQGIGASVWWPCKDHPSDEPEKVTLTVIQPSGLEVICNGTDKGTFQEEDETSEVYKLKTYRVWEVNYPINLYDVTLNIGDYAHHRTTVKNGGKDLAVDIYFLKPHFERAVPYFKDKVPSMLQCFERYVGTYPFPKDGFGLVETPYWGMEHQGAVAYGNNFRDSTLGFPMDFILIHESAHEWFGNSLSAWDDGDLWLHEGFTTYMEALYLECMLGKDDAAKYLLKQKNLIQNKEPLIGPYSVNYHTRPDNDIYYKGAWVLHTLRHALGSDSLFFDIFRKWVENKTRRIIHSEDFVRHVTTMTNKNWEPFFRQYLYLAKLPVLEYKWTRKKLKYRWKEAASGLDIPVFINQDEKEMKLIPTNEWKEELLKRPRKAQLQFVAEKQLIEILEK